MPISSTVREATVHDGRRRNSCYDVLLFKKKTKRDKERKYWVHPIQRVRFSLQVAADGGFSASISDKCDQCHSYS